MIGPPAVAPTSALVRQFLRGAAASLLLITALGCAPNEAGSPLEILYAASLAPVMEGSLTPAFAAGSGRAVRGEPHGSVAGARLVTGSVRQPDVYITADATTFQLLGPLWEGWAVDFSAGELVVAYTPDGRFRATLDSAAAGQAAWHEVLLRPGFRLGRTDPDLDPKGYRTLWLYELAGRHYGEPDLARRLAGSSDASRLIFPEAHLAARLEAGQLDAGIFYLAEALGHGLRTIRLPPQIHQGAPELAELYAELDYRTREGHVIGGSPIVYSATIPANARRREAGVEFLLFLVGAEGRAVLQRAGLPPAPRLAGDTTRAPRRLRAELAGAGP